MKKIIVLISLLTLGFITYTFAFNEFSYEKAKGLAQEYIDNSLVGDDNWKTTHPKIAGEGKYFYTDSDSPSYVEFKVNCDTTPDCGFIMVNFDGDDVSIPVASTSGNTPSEILIAQNGGNSDTNKLYYLNPFEQYAENQTSGEVSSVDPKDSIENTLKQDTKSTVKEKEQKRKDFKKKLKDRLDTNKKEAGDYKKTDDFKQKRKELKDKKLTISKDEISMKVLPFIDYADASTPPLNNGGYTPITASNTFVSGSSTTNCGSRIPCYNQYTSTYNGKTAWSGCSPTAVAMIYGYYDRQGTFPNLVTGIATDVSNSSSPDSNIKSIIDSVRTYMGTTYVLDPNNSNIYEGSTTKANIPLSIQYAKDKGYSKSTATYTSGSSTTLFPTIKSEVNAGRPVLLSTDNHSIVVYGYNNTITTANIVRVNLGWGPSATITGTDNNTYYYSNIDYNMNYIYYGNPATNHSTQGITTFKLSN